MVFGNNGRIDKTMGRPTVNESLKEFIGGTEFRNGDGDDKGVGIRKSGRVEAGFRKCTNGFNAALSPCWVRKAAQDFFAFEDLDLSSDRALAARALAALELLFLHSFAI